MKRIPFGISEAHAQLVQRAREERAAFGDGEPTYSAEFTCEALDLIDRIRRLGKDLHPEEAREQALSLMSYWILTLCRSGHFPNDDAPYPELDPYAPDVAPFTDDDYPWPRLAAEADLEATGPLRIWKRQAHEGTELLQSRKLIGITGAAGSGRSHFIEHGLVPELLSVEKDLDVIRLTPVGPFGTNDRTETREDDTHFVEALTVEMAKATGTAAVSVDELLKRPQALADRLTKDGQRRLLIVHDLNLLFVLADDPGSHPTSQGQLTFLRALLAISEVQGHFVIVDLQRAYVGRLAGCSEFHGALEKSGQEANDGAAPAIACDGWLIINHLPEELSEFVDRPADEIGLGIEPGFRDRLISDHLGEPAALPLLLFTLRRLWCHMLAGVDGKPPNNLLTQTDYHAVKGGARALDIAAREALLRVEHESPHAKIVTRILFCEMVRVLPTGRWWLDDTNTAEVLSALARDPMLKPLGRGARERLLEKVIGAFVQVGIIIRSTEDRHGDRSFLRMAHPALTEVWTQLVDWIASEQETYRIAWRLRSEAREWRALKRSSGCHPGRWLDAVRSLLRGARLRETLKWSVGKKLQKLERDFLRWSRIAHWFAKGSLIGAVCALAIGVLWRDDWIAGHMLAIFDERGVAAQNDGDLSLSAPWLAAAISPGPKEPGFRVVEKLPDSLKSKQFKRDEMTRRVRAKMALDRFPALVACLSKNDKNDNRIKHFDDKLLFAADWSHGSKWVALAFKDENERTCLSVSQLGVSSTARDLVLPDGMKINSLSFLENNSGDDANQAILAVRDGSRIVLWNVASLAPDGKPAQTIDVDGEIRHMVFRRVNGVPTLAVGLAIAAPGPADPNRVVHTLRTVGRTALKAVQGRGMLTHGELNVFKFVITSDGVEKCSTSISSSGFGDAGPVIRVAIGNDGTVATAQTDPTQTRGSTIRVLSKTGEADLLLTEIGMTESPAEDITFHLGEHPHLAVGTSTPDDKSGSVWLANRGDGSWSWHQLSRQDAGLTHVLFSPDGKTLASTAKDGTLCFWSQGDIGFPTQPLEVEEGGWIWSAAWSPDGRFLATGNRDRHLRLWNATDGSLALPPLHHGDTVGTLDFSKDGFHLLATTLNSARIWSTQPAGTKPLAWLAVDTPIRATMSRDGHCAVVVDRYRAPGALNETTEAKIWAGTSMVPRTLAGVRQIVPSDGGKWAVSLTRRGDLEDMEIWDLGEDPSGSPEKPRHTERLPSSDGDGSHWMAAFENDDGSLTIAVERRSHFLKMYILKVYHWDGSSCEEVFSKPLHFAPTVAAYSRTARLLAVGGSTVNAPESGPRPVTFAIVDCGAGEFLKNTELPQDPTTALAFSHSGHRLVVGAVDDRVRVFEISRSGALTLKASEEHTADVTSAGFFADEDRLVSTSFDGSAVIWRIDEASENLIPLVTMVHPGPTLSHALSEENDWLAVGAQSEVRLWPVPDASQREPARPEALAVLPRRIEASQVAFSGDLLLALGYGEVRGQPRVEASRWEVQGGDGPALREKLESISARQASGAGIKTFHPSLTTGLPHFSLTADIARHKNACIASATRGQWEAAKDHLCAWMKKEPQDFATIESNGYWLGGQIAAATWDFTLIIALAGDDPEKVSETLGLALIRVGGTDNLERARTIFKQADESQYSTWEHRAEVEIRAKHTDTARGILAEALERDWSTKDRISLIQRLGAVLLDEGETEQWQKLLHDPAITNPPDDLAARAMWAVALGDSADSAIYEKYATLATKIDDNRKNRGYALLNTLALAQLRAGKVDDAARLVREAITHYEHWGDAGERSAAFPGRPTEWIVEAMILLERAGRARKSEIASQLRPGKADLTGPRHGNEHMDGGETSEALLKWAIARMNAVRSVLDDERPLAGKEARGVWNLNDLEVLLKQAEKRVERIKRITPFEVSMSQQP